MGYVLAAVVARREPLGRVADSVPRAQVVPLADEIELIPVTYALLEEGSGTREVDPFPLLSGAAPPPWLTEQLRQASHHGRVAYVEAEFFGGEGVQAAIGWENGEIALGPMVEEDDDLPPPLEQGAINQALRWLGVRVARGRIDEFETVGLGRHRETDDWLSEG